MKKEKKLTWDMLIDYQSYINPLMYDYLYDNFKDNPRRVYFKQQIESEPYSKLTITEIERKKQPLIIGGLDVSPREYMIVGGINLSPPDEGDVFLTPMVSKELALFIVTNSPMKESKGFMVDSEIICFADKEFLRKNAKWALSQFELHSVKLYNGY
jgi:hypothetical protein